MESNSTHNREAQIHGYDFHADMCGRDGLAPVSDRRSTVLAGGDLLVLLCADRRTPGEAEVVSRAAKEAVIRSTRGEERTRILSRWSLADFSLVKESTRY